MLVRFFLFRPNISFTEGYEFGVLMEESKGADSGERGREKEIFKKITSYFHS